MSSNSKLDGNGFVKNKNTTKPTQKYEFIKETEVRMSGVETWYFTRLDGTIVSGSMSQDHVDALKFYQKLLLTGRTKSLEVLETNIIELT